VVLSEGCPEFYGSNCSFSRGNIFHVENSTSWLSAHTTPFALGLEENLGYSDNGQYGFDIVSLGTGPQLQLQLVAGIATSDFWLGIFGLDPSPANFSNLENPRPSFISTLVNDAIIPSTAWGYTAGAYYREFF
jgi:hypothetical protein